MKRLIVRLVFVLCGGLCLVVLSADAAAAHDCSSDADCEQTGGYNGAIAVIGGVAAVAAAAVAAAAHTPPGEKTDLAILQVDSDTVDIDAEHNAQVTLTGWHAGDGGKLTRVAMSIWIDPAPGGGIVVEPAQGESQLVATIRLDETNPTDASEAELLAHGVWDGKEATQMITVRLGGSYELRLR